MQVVKRVRGIGVTRIVPPRWRHASRATRCNLREIQRYNVFFIELLGFLPVVVRKKIVGAAPHRVAIANGCLAKPEREAPTRPVKKFREYKFPRIHVLFGTLLRATILRKGILIYPSFDPSTWRLSTCTKRATRRILSRIYLRLFSLPPTRPI